MFGLEMRAVATLSVAVVCMLLTGAYVFRPDKFTWAIKAALIAVSVLNLIGLVLDPGSSGQSLTIQVFAVVFPAALLVRGRIGTVVLCVVAVAICTTGIVAGFGVLLTVATPVFILVFAAIREGWGLEF